MPSSDVPARSARLVMRGVTKAFGPTVALAGVDLEVRAGEVHALLGENGAGKSTLMKVLAGAHRPDAGEMVLDGKAYAPRDPLAARAAGVAMIYQELALAPHLTVLDNVMLGREHRRGPIVDRATATVAVREAFARLDHAEIDCNARVGSLAPATRQVVELARALVHDARVVVLDEPTSSLGARDVDRLFAVVRRLVEGGLAVIWISHFLEEVQQIASRYTVLRDGRTVATGDVASTSIDDLVVAMAGRALGDVFSTKAASASAPAGDVLLRVAGIVGRGELPRSASLELRRSEVLGIGGLCGAGRTELLRGIFGLDDVAAGHVSVGVVDAPIGAGPRARWLAGVGLVSEDRKDEGLALNRSVAENLTLTDCRRVAGPFGVVDRKRRRAEAQRWIDEFGVRVRDPDQAIGELSGGNQQKVAIARLLYHDVDVLLLDEPTRGIDVGSKAEIYRLIRRAAANGKCVLLVSSYLPELLGVCDRIAVMHRGVLGPARPVDAWDQHELLVASTAGEDAGARDGGAP